MYIMHGVCMGQRVHMMCIMHGAARAYDRYHAWGNAYAYACL